MLAARPDARSAVPPLGLAATARAVLPAQPAGGTTIPAACRLPRPTSHRHPLTPASLSHCPPTRRPHYVLAWGRLKAALLAAAAAAHPAAAADRGAGAVRADVAARDWVAAASAAFEHHLPDKKAFAEAQAKVSVMSRLVVECDAL